MPKNNLATLDARAIRVRQRQTSPRTKLLLRGQAYGTGMMVYIYTLICGLLCLRYVTCVYTNFTTYLSKLTTIQSCVKCSLMYQQHAMYSV